MAEPPDNTAILEEQVICCVTDAVGWISTGTWYVTFTLSK
jgi:hypothetical protein